MAQESNESISYLLALKQSIATSAPATKTESSNAVDGNASRGEQFQGAEKRRSPRYRCEGSAEIREEGRDVRTWATFTDISLHGCYLEAQATYPSGTALHMKLKANGIVLETKGTVRVTLPLPGHGHRF